ncbi:hypothetical protein Bca101_082510 [Brassica carinata]
MMKASRRRRVIRGEACSTMDKPSAAVRSSEERKVAGGKGFCFSEVRRGAIHPAKVGSSGQPDAMCSTPWKAWD